MFHLKQETAAKATAQYTSETLERKVKASKKRITSIGQERDAIHAKMTLLKSGAEILEGQLRSLDGRFVQLRGTLDWSVHHSRTELKECSREFVRLSSQIESYKDKWCSAEEKVRKLDYDVKHLKQKVAARPHSIAAPTIAVLGEHQSGSGTDEEEGSQDVGKEQGSREEGDTGEKNKKKNQKKTVEPTWRYETVSTSGGGD